MLSTPILLLLIIPSLIKKFEKDLFWKIRPKCSDGIGLQYSDSRWDHHTHVFSQHLVSICL